MVKKRLSSFSDLQTTMLHQIRFGNIYILLNKLIPAFVRTVDDLNKMHPGLTVSTCNTDGYSVLVPGTKVNQRKPNKAIQMGPGQGTGLSYKTNLLSLLSISDVINFAPLDIANKASSIPS